MTSFLGWSAERVATAGDDEWEDVHRRLHAWAALLRRRGLASLSETITLIERLPGRVLAETDGERRLTDLRHVGQLLHGAAAAERLGTAALAVWLRQRVAEAEQEGDEERSRRLESDDEAVQVLTIHRSKGLEFPVVYVPYLWEPTWVDEKPIPIVYHDPDAGFRRTIDVGLAGPDYRSHKDLHVAEQRGEDLRLAYVALTRAKHQAVVWWAGSWNSRDSALSRLLLARDDDGSVARPRPGPPSDDAAIERFRELASAAPGCVSVERASAQRPAGRWSGAAPGDGARSPRRRSTASWTARWRRTSYSDITAAAHEARVASEPEETRGRRRARRRPLRRLVPTTRRSPAGSRRARSRRALRGRRRSRWPTSPAARRSARSCTPCFEAADFAAADLDARARRRGSRETLARRPVDIGAPGGGRRRAAGGDRDAARPARRRPAAARRRRARTGSTSSASSCRWRAATTPHRRGSRRARSAPCCARISARTTRSRATPTGSRTRSCAPRVRGYLTGSIDLVLRVGERVRGRRLQDELARPRPARR